jgi:hypothetical protein
VYRRALWYERDVPIIELGPNREILGEDRYAIPDEAIAIPRFGTHCVCCGADARGRTDTFVAPTDQGAAVRVAMPVCWDCRDHALGSSARPAFAAVLLFVGAAIVGLAGYFLGKRHGSAWQTGMIITAVVVTVLGMALMIHAAVAERRRRNRDGHFPGVVFRVASGSARLFTRNERLADELLALNPGARRTADPVERNAGRIPSARVVKTGDGGLDPDEHASEIVQRVVAGKPDDLAFVRAAIARGTVQHRLVEGLLAETEAALGRRDLVARYRSLRPSAPP